MSCKLHNLEVFEQTIKHLYPKESLFEFALQIMGILHVCPFSSSRKHEHLDRISTSDSNPGTGSVEQTTECILLCGRHFIM